MFVGDSPDLTDEDLETALQAVRSAKDALAIAYDNYNYVLQSTCEHVPGTCTYLIDRGPTYEGVDYRGCTRCKVRL
jgi:hypothetical protein